MKWLPGWPKVQSETLPINKQTNNTNMCQTCVSTERRSTETDKGEKQKRKAVSKTFPNPEGLHAWPIHCQQPWWKENAPGEEYNLFNWGKEVDGGKRTVRDKPHQWTRTDSPKPGRQVGASGSPVEEKVKMPPGTQSHACLPQSLSEGLSCWKLSWLESNISKQEFRRKEEAG